MRLFPDFYQMGSTFVNVYEPDKPILYNSQLSEDGELMIELCPDGEYRLMCADMKCQSKFYNLFPSQKGTYDFILSKIEQYYESTTNLK